jgi:glycosyltransferase involved in cell wall biosynthesis
MEINSKAYWDYRFKSDWQIKQGSEQTRFFAEIAIGMFPAWLSDWIENNDIEFCDWGCALGDAVIPIAKRFPNAKITGIDISDEAIAIASESHKQADFVVEDWLYGNNTKQYDLVFSSNTLEHFEAPWVVANKLVARASSFLVLMLPYREVDRISEHLASIEPDSIPYALDNGTFVLLHSSIDESHLRLPSYWSGEQILLVYGNRKLIPQLNLHVGSITISSNANGSLLRELSNAKNELELVLRNRQEVELSKQQIQQEIEHIENDKKHIGLDKQQLTLERQQVELSKQQIQQEIEHIENDKKQIAQDKAELERMQSQKDTDADFLRLQLSQFQNSLSWRITSPLRASKNKLLLVQLLMQKVIGAYKIGGPTSVLRKAFHFFLRKKQSWPFVNNARRYGLDIEKIINSNCAFEDTATPWAGMKNESPGVIMYVIDFCDGGLERVVIDLCVELRQRGYAAWILVANHGGRAMLEAINLGIWVQECHGSAEQIEDALLSFPSKIVMTHHCYDNLDIFEKNQLPIIEILHNAYFWHRDDPLMFSARKKIAHFIAVSKSVFSYGQTYLGINKDQMTIIANGLSPIGLIRPPQALRTRLRKVDGEPVRIVHPASFGPQKRHALVVAAFNKIAAAFPTAQLIFAGTPEVNIDVYRRVKEIAKKSPYAERIIFSGTLDRRQISKLLAQARLALLPSSVEGFSIASLEFAYFGLPCVMSDTGSATELIEKYGHGIISGDAAIPYVELSSSSITTACFEAEEKAVGNLANAITTILNNYESFAAKASLASEHWQDYSMALTANQYESFLTRQFNLKGVK